MVSKQLYFGTFLNIILVASGPILLCFGLYMAYYYFMFKPFVDPLVWIFPLVIAILGLLSIIVAIFGFCGGALSYPGIYFTLVFIIVAASIVIGSYWVNAHDNSPEFVFNYMEKAYRHYDRLDQKYLWQKLHRKFECCGVNGPRDFHSSGRSIPIECYYKAHYVKSQLGTNLQALRESNSTSTNSTADPHPTHSTEPTETSEIVGTGCSNAMTKRLILDRLIMGSMACATGLLILLLLIISFFITFQEDGEVYRDYDPEMEDDAMEMDELYGNCNLNRPCGENFNPDNLCGQNYNELTAQCVQNLVQSRKPPIMELSCSPAQRPTTSCAIVQPIPQYCPTQIGCPAGGGLSIDPLRPGQQITVEGAYSPQLSNGLPTAPVGGQVCMVVLPPNANSQAAQQARIENILPPVMQDIAPPPTRPIQLQIPDMGFLSSLMPNRGRSRYRRRHRRRRRRDTDRSPMSIIPVPSVNGFMVCNTQQRDSSSEDSY